MIRVLVGGDFCPVLRPEPLLVSGAVETLFPEHLPLFLASDLFLVNLEGPLCTHSKRLEKVLDTPVKSSPDCVNGMKAANIKVVNLANNHILDYNSEGLRETISALDRAGIEYFGAGDSIDAARKPYITEIRGTKIGMIGVTAHEFSIASTTSAGANPIDLYRIGQDLTALRSEVDFLLITVHAGHYNYQYPSPKLQQLCHMLVDFGADAVICQHSHIAGTVEEYNNKLIVYGQGNLLFDAPLAGTEWTEGFLIELRIENKHKLNYQLHPFEQCAKQVGLRKLPAETEERFWRALSARNSRITTTDSVSELWDEWCTDKTTGYFGSMILHNRIFHRLNRMFGFAQKMISGKRRWLYLNYVRCENHREILETILDRDK